MPEYYICSICGKIAHGKHSHKKTRRCHRGAKTTAWDRMGMNGLRDSFQASGWKQPPQGKHGVCSSSISLD